METVILVIGMAVFSAILKKDGEIIDGLKAERTQSIMIR